MKQVFHFLIKEAPYLIDDKSYERSQEVGGKESLKIKIDAVRKSLGIEEMPDVELLVDVLYKYQEKHEAAMDEERKRMEAEENEENENNPDGNPNQGANNNDPRRTSNEATLNANGEAQASHEEEEVDENKLRLNADLLTPALKEFHKEREERDLKKEYMNQKNKKKSKDSKNSDKTKDAELKKKKEKLYWSHMTQILTEQKLSVWKALDKSLSAYYQLLVDRQNLIEETGLLNQQNEELKTLLNQYLQAGVNQELQVPPTQVIRLDI